LRVSGKKTPRIRVQISQFIPVLKDPSLGADLHTGHFADTA
jgi:hypothetical protein